MTAVYSGCAQRQNWLLPSRWCGQCPLLNSFSTHALTDVPQSEIMSSNARLLTAKVWGSLGMRTHLASLRVRLLLLVLLAVLPMLALVLHSYFQQVQAATEEAQANALRLARLAAGDQERLTEGARQLLVALAQLPSVRSQDAAECTSFLADLLKEYPLYENMGAANLDGDIFCSAVPFATSTNMSDRPAFQLALRTRDFVVGDYIIARITGRPTLGTAYPVLDEAGQPLGVVFAGIDLAWLDSFVAEAHLPVGSSLSVIDSEGIILTRYPDPERWRGTAMPDSVMEPLLAQSELVNEAEGIDGTARLYGTTRLRSLPAGDVLVRVGIPSSVVYADAQQLLIRNLATLGLASLLVFGAVWGGARLFVLSPLNALLGAIRRFEAGDTGARVGDKAGGGELGYVADAFDDMAAALEERESERDRSELALRRHIARSAALATIAARLNAELDPQSVFSLVCLETARALQLSAASVTLYDERLDSLRIVSYFGLPEDLAEQSEALGWGPYTQRLKAGETVIVPDLREDPALRDVPPFVALDLGTLVSTPMVHEGQLVGTLCVYAQGEVRHFVEGELAFLKAVSDQAAQAIANARLYAALQAEQRARAQLLDKTITAQEEERRRIARELHDQTSQDLAALMIGLDTCALGLATDKPELDQHLQMARSIAETMLANTRRLINDLRPSLLDDLGLAAAIAWYGEQRLERTGVALEFQCDQMETRLPSYLETALFRITQEALTNVVRHAHASAVQVTLKVQDHAVILTVRDDGRGFEEPAATPTGTERQGLGLLGMSERVSTLGGEMRVDSQPGRGTAITVTVPLPPQENRGA
jgi:signal transduction histidine kinase